MDARGGIGICHLLPHSWPGFLPSPSPSRHPSHPRPHPHPPQIVCNSLLKQCLLPENDAWVQDTTFGGTLLLSSESRKAMLEMSTPVVRVCKADCEKAVSLERPMCGGGVVYNSLLLAASRKGVFDSQKGVLKSGEDSDPRAPSARICGMSIDPVSVLLCRGGGVGYNCSRSMVTSDLYRVYGATSVHSVLDLGSALFQNMGRVVPCQRSMSWLETTASVVGPNVSSPLQSTTHYGGGGGGDIDTGFNAFVALQFVSCPKPWIKHDTVDAVLLESAVQNTALAENDNIDALLSPEAYFHNRFCLASCPSTVFSEGEYSTIWLCYVVPGLIAFVCNFAVFAEITWTDFQRTVRTEWIHRIFPRELMTTTRGVSEVSSSSPSTSHLSHDGSSASSEGTYSE